MVDSATMLQSHGSRADCSILIKAQFSALDTAAKRGTSDEVEDTLQRGHEQRIKLEAADCDAMQYAFY